MTRVPTTSGKIIVGAVQVVVVKNYWFWRDHVSQKAEHIFRIIFRP